MGPPGAYHSVLVVALDEYHNYFAGLVLRTVCPDHCRPTTGLRSDDRVLGVQPSNHVVGETADMGEGSSDEEGDEEEPIYDQPDEGDDDFNE